MANQPPRSGASKEKDDDSWGKLASDLFGIQFGKTDDDDFDLPDEEASPVATPSETKPTPTLADVVPVAESAKVHSEEEPDVSFPEEDDIPAPVVKPKPRAEVKVQAEPVDDVDDDEPVPTSGAQIDSEKDIWNLLESWNWDEQPRETSRHTSDQDSRASGRRSQGGRSSSQRRPEGDTRRERGGDRGSDRPARPAEGASVPTSEEPREPRPRREERPRRSDAPDRDRARSERSPESRPVRAEGHERRPQRSEPPKESNAGSDDFATGINDEAVRPQPARERSRPAPRRPSPPPKASAPEDDFDSDLFAELDAIQADESTVESTPAGEASDEDAADGEEPRRRRRRRRRGPRNRQEEGTLSDVIPEDALESTEVVESGEDDAGSMAPGESTEESSADEDRGPRRRRRRRRVRRRGEEPVERTEAIADEIEDLDETPAAEPESVEESFEDEEEPVVAVSYEGIPSWEEAISYLQRRPRESRPRGDGSSRGRGGPHRR